MHINNFAERILIFIADITQIGFSALTGCCKAGFAGSRYQRCFKNAQIIKLQAVAYTR